MNRLQIRRTRQQALARMGRDGGLGKVALMRAMVDGMGLWAPRLLQVVDRLLGEVVVDIGEADRTRRPRVPQEGDVEAASGPMVLEGTSRGIMRTEIETGSGTGTGTDVFRRLDVAAKPLLVEEVRLEDATGGHHLHRGLGLDRLLPGGHATIESVQCLSYRQKSLL